MSDQNEKSDKQLKTDNKPFESYSKSSSSSKNSKRHDNSFDSNRSRGPKSGDTEDSDFHSREDKSGRLMNNLGIKLKETIKSSSINFTDRAAERPNRVNVSESDQKKTPKSSSKNVTEKGIYATGKRKTSIARVWVKKGSGNFVVNGKNPKSYFGREFYCENISKPFVVTKTSGEFDVWCTVSGGGHTGQSDAIKLGISRALDKFNSTFRPMLKTEKLLTRDSRIVERKKYGKHGARKSTQFSKR